MSVRRSAFGAGLRPLAFIAASRKASIGFLFQGVGVTSGGLARRGGCKAQKRRSSGVMGRSISLAVSSSFVVGLGATAAAAISKPSNEAPAAIQRRSVSISASANFLPGGIVGFS